MESYFKRTLEAGIVAAGVMLSGPDVSAKEKEKPEQSVQELATFIRQEIELSRKEMIKYPDTPLSQENGMKLARAIKRFDTDTMNLFGVREASVSRVPTRSEMRQAQKKLWNALVPFVSSLPKTYSDAGLFHALIYDVPRVLAPYWIYADHQLITYGDRSASDGLEVRSNIFTIRHKLPLRRTVVDVDVNTDVLFLNNPIGSSTLQGGEMANARYGNIFIQDRSSEKMIEIWNTTKYDIGRTIGTLAGNPRSLPNDPRLRNDLVCMLALRDLFGSTKEPSMKECEDAHISHEVSHVANKQDVRFKNVFESVSMLSGEQFVAAQVNESSHEELDAILSSLRYSSNKDIQLLQFFIFLLSGSNKTSLPHHAGSLWIRKHLMEEMSRDPKHYGVAIQNDSPFTIGEQVLLALPRLIRQQPEEMSALWESLWKLHRQHLGVNLLDAAMQSPYPQPESKQEKSTDSFLPLMSAGLGACGLFAALHALRRKLKTMEHEKRRVTELSAQLSKLLTNRATGDQLIQDLQLGMRGKGVDTVAREQAYETITKISRSNKDLRQHMKAIRMLIGKPIE